MTERLGGMTRLHWNVVLTVLFLAFCYGRFWSIAVIMLVVATGVYAVRYGRRWWAAEQRRRAELVARADQQHRQVLNDDPRGTHGIYPPAV